MISKERKIEKFLESNLNSDIRVSIFRNPEGDYLLFGKYVIKNKKGLYEVTLDLRDDINLLFSSLKIAVTWCVFHDRKRSIDCKTIEKLDFKLSDTYTDIAQHKRILDTCKDEQLRMIYYTKLEEDEDKKEILIKKLNKYINISTGWQNMRYANAKTSNKR